MDDGQFTAATKWGVALAFAGTLLIAAGGALLCLVLDSHARLDSNRRAVATDGGDGWAGLLVAMLPVAVVWIASGGPWLVWSGADIGFALAAIGHIGLVPTMLGNLPYLNGIALLGPARAAAFLCLSPLFSAAFSIGRLGEQLSWYHLGGIAAIFVGPASSLRSRPA
jgi:drug/metabolite transporter (DMT)-like permease